MKSQDIAVLLKLVCLENRQSQPFLPPKGWQDWRVHDTEAVIGSGDKQAALSVRGLAELTGISKSQVALSMKRMRESGLLLEGLTNGQPMVNRKGLFEFLVHGLRYVFPVRPGPVGRGIKTTASAPVFKGGVQGGGELPMIWADPKGLAKGQVIEPLYSGVALAVKRDSEMYALLALVDSIRLGNAREKQWATQTLKNHLHHGVRKWQRKADIPN